jgi:Skp family chaperone for outer membrane proteins
MHRYATALLLVAALSMSAQTLTPKPSPALDTLNQAAKDVNTDQSNLNTLIQQARASLDQNQKAITDELTKIQKGVNDDLAKDKKYKDRLDKMQSLQKQLQDLGAKANNELNRNGGAIQQKLQGEQAVMTGLIPVIRKENGWADTVQYNSATQQWADSAKPAEKK